MTFLPQWLPQAQFAGYYVAYQKGFYREQGVDLRILRGGPEHPPPEMLAKRRVQAATMFLSEALEQRGRGIPLLNIGQIAQRSGFLLVAKKDRGIARPADLQHRKVGLWPSFQVQAQAFFRRYGLAVVPVVQGATVNMFLRGGVDAASAMWYNEYHTLLNAGINAEELTVFSLHDHGLRFPEDGIYVLEETFRRDPAGCCRFVRASLAGWRYAFAHPEEAVEIVMQYIREARLGSNRVHQRWMLARMRDLIQADASFVPGVLQERDYDAVVGELRKSGLLRKPPPYGRFHVSCPEAP